MLSAGEWIPDQQNEITFVMVDTTGDEVSGLGTTFMLSIRKSGGVFVIGNGTKTEIGLGWYSYLATAAEADTIGPVAVVVTGAGTVQQNLEYVCGQRTPSALEFTYTVRNSITANPIPGVKIQIGTDMAGANIIWSGITDTFGVSRDTTGHLPRLEPGTYRIFRQLSGFIFSDPDVEEVS